ncbi:hypothetical protein QA312_10480 [Glaesserella parasuis]|uniref:hypothetical protein n=2 Tax=Glaesserella parasuis TaxID=738 RepID=UPI002436A814|nr:hypothetical protein [Glaesserella parasuis]MDG6304313.1 hypothetical protein [Glaesserella parasuis]MDG6824339.1 hypothetical protein [Glaesserella parasuis]MDG6833343.1 hypothetical protein [Glaesserella parasuis]MDO9959438.1 hypothetical protein [Glaesserella parasuis]MDP0052876.1 hypothetical protein [Glaesserella parasuis]
MKQKASFRINEQLHDKLKAFANSQGITTSQLIELACYHFMEEKPKPTKQIERSKKLEVIDLQFRIDQPTYKDLIKIIRAKNSTLSQEIYYRLSATLTAPIFDTQEFQKLEHLHFDLNRLGNLFKLAVDQKTPINDTLLLDIQKHIQALSDEVDKALTHSYKRKL